MASRIAQVALASFATDSFYWHLPIAPQHVQGCKQTRFPQTVDAVLHPRKRVSIGDSQRVEYLGHVITPGRLSVANDVKATCAVREATFPESITQLRSFLGACNVYRRFVKDYSKIASPFPIWCAKTPAKTGIIRRRSK